MDFNFKDFYDIGDLLKIMKLLRSECPWDREQTHASIRKNFLEETYEVLEAIDNSDAVLLQEELGDVLLQVVFHSEMESEKGSFGFSEVCDGICKKLIQRHPHIFSGLEVNSADDVLKNWDVIKNRSKGHATKTQTLRDVPRVLPSLMRAQKIMSRAKKAGLELTSKQAMKIVSDRVNMLCSCIEETNEPNNADEILGELLLSCTAAAAALDIDSEEALSHASNGFINRFEQEENSSANNFRNAFLWFDSETKEV